MSHLTHRRESFTPAIDEHFAGVQSGQLAPGSFANRPIIDPDYVGARQAQVTS